MANATTLTCGSEGDPVSVFEARRAEMLRSKRAMNLLFILLFAAAFAASIYVSRFYPDRLASGLPRIFEYFGTIMPNLELDKLLLPRGDNGRAVPGSIL